MDVVIGILIAIVLFLFVVCIKVDPGLGEPISIVFITLAAVLVILICVNLASLLNEPITEQPPIKYHVKKEFNDDKGW